MVFHAFGMVLDVVGFMDLVNEFWDTTDSINYLVMDLKLVFPKPVCQHI